MEKTRVKCSVCGKEMYVPKLYREDDRLFLSPYCCSFALFTVQWLVHHGWHVRDLGWGDSHPYYCDDCWVAGVPEYEKKDYGAIWCEQAEELLK